MVKCITCIVAAINPPVSVFEPNQSTPPTCVLGLITLRQSTKACTAQSAAREVSEKAMSVDYSVYFQPSLQINDPHIFVAHLTVKHKPPIRRHHRVSVWVLYTSSLCSLVCLLFSDVCCDLQRWFSEDRCFSFQFVGVRALKQGS